MAGLHAEALQLQQQHEALQAVLAERDAELQAQKSQEAELQETMEELKAALGMCLSGTALRSACTLC